MSKETNNNKLEKSIEFGIGIIGLVSGIIWRFIIAFTNDKTMHDWAAARKIYGWEFFYRDIYRDYWNTRANVLIAIGIIALAIGIYRFKIKKTNKISEKDSSNDNLKN